jgi:PAS domain S-box-containing protein
VSDSLIHPPRPGVAAEDLLTAVLQTVGQPVWVVDHDGRIRFANPAAVAALGYDTLDELPGRPSHETIHHHRHDGRPYPAAECPMLLPRTTGERVACELDWFFRRDGSTFPVSYVSVPLELPDGRGAVVAFTDIERRLQDDERLRRRDAALSQQHAALRRVATLVAGDAPSVDVFASVAREVASVLGVAYVELSRYGCDSTATIVGAWSDEVAPFPPGTRWPLDNHTVSAQVLERGGPARVEDVTRLRVPIAKAVRALGIRSVAGAPIVVDGRVWGLMAAGWSRPDPLPDGIEHRLEDFTQLVAAAISHTQEREDLGRLAAEQAALRRAATLVAQGAEPRVVFDTVCEQTGRLFDATTVNLAHFTDDGCNETIAGWSLRDVHVPPGTVLPLEGDTINALVQRTAGPGRVDSYEDAEGHLADLLRRRGIRSEVGAPVVVDGVVWGALIAGTDERDPLPAGTERRLASFAELIGTAISNATTRSELIGSRARIVEAAYEQRRRIVRDLHDGAQQRFVQAIMALQLARGRPDLRAEIRGLVNEALDHARAGLGDLRDLARGIHPAILTHYGLAAAIESLADRATVPVEIDIAEARYAPAVESAAYFVVAEALTNVAKYAHATRASVTATEADGRLELTITDDGVGGARRAAGGGLFGLDDRVTALHGTLSIDSPAGSGTRVHAEIPLALAD